MAWSAEEVARAIGTPTPRAPAAFSSISTDTRSLEPGALFVALQGERYDGHAFLEPARAAGARGVVVRRGAAVPAGLVRFEVEDTLVAYGRLATERRCRVRGPVVAVTGTNGKTATKEMLRSALATRWALHATPANLNNLIGVPQTILGAPDGTEALVIEAGASVPGEVARLRDIVRPDIAVVTNVSAGHVEGFGTVAGVFREKVSLLEGAAVAVVGIEPPELIAAARQTARRAVSAGSEGWADVHPASWRLGQDGRGHVEIDGCRFVLPVVGRHQVDNAMLAWAVARELRLDLAAVARALERVSLPPGRGQVLRHGDLTVLHDAYNANPRSVVASLETAVAMSRGRPLVFVLGSMLELGSESDRWHRDVASRAVELEPSLVAAVGAFVPAFEAVGQELGDRLLTAPDPVTLGPLLKARLSGDELVVLKASRGQRLERLIPFLVPDGEAPCSITS